MLETLKALSKEEETVYHIEHGRVFAMLQC